MTRRVALVVAYDGAAFHGFQFQDGDIATVQRDLERAIARVADHDISLTCAGRTDTGVHATHQVIHFDTEVSRPAEAWLRGTNRYLPETVSVHWAGEVPGDFDARFSATARRYVYLIDNAPVRSALMTGSITWQPRKLDARLMHAGAQYLLGEHDFSSFRAASCQSRSPVRDMQRIDVSRRGELVVVDLTASAFLHHMVRNIVGTLYETGLGRHSPEWIGEVLAARDRTRAGTTARPDGLYLVDVQYPDAFGVPRGPDLPHLYSYISS
ncbi:MAG: tRNA pseudouridine(38-40) synthase TruA [Pseudomonadales bacterium]|nr:tRNA pseudouridine(38-40) synthase TruA [Pseudomonadales bacterium]